MSPNTSPASEGDFSRAELGRFGALANRRSGGPSRLRASGSRGGERPRTQARAGTAHPGQPEAERCL